MQSKNNCIISWSQLLNIQVGTKQSSGGLNTIFTDLVLNPFPQDMNALKAERNKLCVLLDLKVPLAIAGVAKVVTPQPVEEFDSYKDLVNRAGY